MKPPSLAFDRSLRSIDADGHMRVEESRISKANICPYVGSEIPGWQELGLDPQRTYRLLRDPRELEKAADTFTGKPLLIKHVAIDADLPRKETWVGTVGTVTWEPPYLVARPLMVLTAEAIALIQSETQRELSSAYRYQADMTPGSYGGEAYDGRMVNIQGNHVAIVHEGRVGPDVHVADELPRSLKRMKHKALFDKLKAEGLLAETVDALAFDAAASSVGETPAESVMSLDESEKEAACDEWKKEHGKDSMSEEEREEAYARARDKKAKDKAKDSKHGKDESEEEEKKAKDKKAKDSANKHSSQNMDEEPDHRKDFEPIKGKDSVTKDEMNAAVKAGVAEARRQERELAKAREAVRPLVGVVSLAMDSADEVYKFALSKHGVKVDGVHPSAYPTLLDVVLGAKRAAPAGTVAMDASRTTHDIDELLGLKGLN